jgi:small acid-soluble spore protein D (minor alpha/beta-type SASP)
MILTVCWTSKARNTFDRFKMEAAREVSVTHNQVYNGNITAKDAGTVGDQMVKKMCLV